MTDMNWLEEFFEGRDLGHGIMADYIRQLQAEVTRLRLSEANLLVQVRRLVARDRVGEYTRERSDEHDHKS